MSGNLVEGVKLADATGAAMAQSLAIRRHCRDGAGNVGSGAGVEMR
jgi:hypothetical protein